MTSNMLGATTPLSRRETAVLAWADRQQRGRVTAHEIAGIVGAPAAAKTASSMVRKRVLDRIGRGVYIVRPLRAAGVLWAISALAAVAHLLTGETYYVGGPAVLTLHRLTTQAYGTVVDVFVTTHRRPREIGSARVVFHVAPPESFASGLQTVKVEGTTVTLSDPERTILDVLEHPDLLGASATFQAIREAVPRVDVLTLIDSAIRRPRTSTCQRLGVLLERAGVTSDELAPLASRVAGAGIAAMVRSAPRRGAVHPIWHIVLNDV